MPETSENKNCPSHEAMQADIRHIRGEITTSVTACRAEIMMEIGHIKEIVSRLSDENRMITKGIGEIRERTVTTDQASKSAHHRLDNSDVRVSQIEAERQEIVRLAMSIERLAESLTAHDAVLMKHDERLNKMEHSAGSFFVKLAQQGAFVVLGIALAYLLKFWG